MSVTKPRVSLPQFIIDCPQGAIAEWVDGEVVEHAPPVTRHQQVAHFLSVLLTLFAELTEAGLVLVAPYLMLLSPDGPAREPDVLCVSRDHAARVLPDRLDGPADLVIEVISDDSARRDRSDKFDEYQKHGVREYWMIDARAGREREDFWVLDGQGRYQPGGRRQDGAFVSTVLPGFWLQPDWLRRHPLPGALATFAEIVGPQALGRVLGAGGPAPSSRNGDSG